MIGLRDDRVPPEVEVAWNRFAERLDDLLCDPADIAPLRQTVLQLAVRGRLVAQDLADEPASVRLVSRVLSPSLEEAPFPLPSGWAWSSVSKLGRVLGGGAPSENNTAFWDGEIPWVTPKDMKRDIIADSQDHITEAAVAGSSVKRVPPGALLMVVRGMILAHSFPTALTTTEVTVNQDMKALVPFDGTVGRFLLPVTKGLKPEVLSLVERSTHWTCKLPTDELFRLPMPIAPWAEQRRIVARVDELMGLLDRLEARLTAARTAHAAFAAAVVHHLDDCPPTPAVAAGKPSALSRSEVGIEDGIGARGHWRSGIYHDCNGLAPCQAPVKRLHRGISGNGIRPKSVIEKQLIYAYRKVVVLTCRVDWGATGIMKVSFKSRKLETLETEASDAGYPADAVRAFRKRMLFLRSAIDERDLRAMKSMRFEKLKGARSHQFSLRLNDQWRLVLEIEEQGNAKRLVIVEIEDYH